MGVVEVGMVAGGGKERGREMREVGGWHMTRWREKRSKRVDAERKTKAKEERSVGGEERAMTRRGVGGEGGREEETFVMYLGTQEHKGENHVLILLPMDVCAVVGWFQCKLLYDQNHKSLKTEITQLIRVTGINK